MLFDQSQLARVCLQAWQVTGDDFYRTITQESLDYVVREMLDPAGGFYSAQDADSEGEEGKFFVWTPAQIREVLCDDAQNLMVAHGVTPGRSFEARQSSNSSAKWSGALPWTRPAISCSRPVSNGYTLVDTRKSSRRGTV